MHPAAAVFYCTPKLRNRMLITGRDPNLRLYREILSNDSEKIRNYKWHHLFTGCLSPPHTRDCGMELNHRWFEYSIMGEYAYCCGVGLLKLHGVSDRDPLHTNRLIETGVSTTSSSQRPRLINDPPRGQFHLEHVSAAKTAPQLHLVSR